jgi:hypothetical protein
MVTMTQYKQVFEEAIKLYSFKKVMAELLLAGKVIEPNTVGQLNVNINSGGVTNIEWGKRNITGIN